MDFQTLIQQAKLIANKERHNSEDQDAKHAFSSVMRSLDLALEFFNDAKNGAAKPAPAAAAS